MKGAKLRSNTSNVLIGLFLVIIAIYITFTIICADEFSSIFINLSGFRVLNTIFVSILMQAFPFMLIGVFVSSIMHVFISNETIVKLFPKKYGLGFLTAMFGGLLLPICECAIVPVAARLVKKGVALPVTVTFMLSAPIINPIVIASTLYAFPERPEIALYRVCFGLTIALAVGLVLLFFPEAKPALLDKCEKHTCDYGHCGKDMKDDRKIGHKIRMMFIHTGEEFFSAGKYLVLGAFLTSLIQTLVPKNIFTALGGINGLALAVMMAAAFLFSVCSTSDAFIARSFLDRFSTGSIMGFLVFGPMIDMKNMFMLLASFRKGFVIKLALIITLFAFVMLYFLTYLFI